MEMQPCPFCDGEAMVICEGPGLYIIQCPRCEASGPYGEDEGLAKLAWNTRTRPDGVVEALKECVEALSVLSDGGTGPGCYAYHRAKKALAAVGGE